MNSGGEEERTRSLDQEIMRLQKSTRTTVPAMLPLHDILRHKFNWYYRWSLWGGSKFVHTIILLLFLVGMGGIFYQFLFSQPSTVMASTTAALYADAKDTEGFGYATSGANNHYLDVSDANADDTQVIKTTNAVQTDIFTSTNPTGISAGDRINKVTVYYRAKCVAAGALSCPIGSKAEIKPSAGSATYESTNITVNASYVDKSYDWTTNPATSSAWQPSELNDIRIGVKGNGESVTSPGGSINLWVTKVWMVVDYTIMPTTPTMTAPTPAATAMTWNFTHDGANVTKYEIVEGATVKVSCNAPASSCQETGLSVNNQYSRQVRAVNNDSYGDLLGTLSAAIGKYTLANTPIAPTVNTPTSNSLKVTIGKPDGNPEGPEPGPIDDTEYAFGIDQDCSTSCNGIDANKWVGVDGVADEAAAFYQTYSAWGGVSGKTVTGLLPSTTYYFRVIARNGDNVATALGNAGNGTTSVGGITISGNVYSAEDKLTNIGANKTIGISVNGGVKSTVETTAGGAFSFTSAVAANNTITLFVDDEAEEGTLVTQAIDAATNIPGLEMYTNKVVLRHETAGPMTNTLLNTAHAQRDSASETDIHLSGDAATITFDAGYEVWIDNVGSGKTFTPAGVVNADSLEIRSGATFNSGSNNVTLTGNLLDSGTFISSGGTPTISVGGNIDFTGGTFTAGTSTVTMSGSGKTLVGDSETFNNLRISGNTESKTTGSKVGGTLTVDNGVTLTITSLQFHMNYLSTTTINGTITSDASGAMVFWDGAGNNLSTSGIFSANAIFAAYTSNVVVPARNYGGYLAIQAYATNYTATLGTAGGQTINVSGYFRVRATGAGNMVVNADTNDPNINITGQLYMSIAAAGVPSITMGSGTWTVSDNVNFTSGTVTAGGSTLTMNGSGKILTSAGQTLNNLTIANAGTKTLADAAAIAGNLNVSGGTLDLSTFTANRTAGGGTLTVGSGATLKIGGTNSIPTNYTAHSFDTSGTPSTVEYSGTTQTVSANEANNYGTLVISGSGTKTLGTAGNVVYGNLTVSAGTLDLGSNTINRNSAGGTLTLSASTTLKIGGTNTFPTNYSTNTIDASSTVEYSGTTQTVAALAAAADYGNLTISGSGTKTLGGTEAVAGNLNISAGTLTLSTYTLNHTGAGSNTLTLAASTTLNIGGTGRIPTNYSTHSISASSTINFAGTNQLVDNLNSSQSYGSLTISGSGTKTLQATVAVAGSLTVSAGTLDLQSFTLNCSGASKTLTVSNGATLKIGGTGTLPSGYSTHTIGATSTIEYAGTTTTVAALTSASYGNLTISGSGVTTTANFTVATALSVTGSLIASTPSSITLSGGTLSNTTPANLVFYDLVTTGTVSTSSSFTVAHLLNNNGGTFQPAAGVITFNNGSAITNSNSNLLFSNLTVADSATLTGNSSFGVGGTFTVGASSVFSPAAGTFISGGTGTLTGTGIARVYTTGDNAFLTQYTITNKTLTDLTVGYYGSGDQGVSAPVGGYGYLRIQNSGFVATLAADVVVNKTLTIAAGALASGNHDLSVGGNWYNAGTFTAGSGKVTLNGSTDQVVHLAGQTTTFNNLDITTAAARAITFRGGTTTTVTGTLNVTGSSGKVITLQSSDGSNWIITPEIANVTYVSVDKSTNGHADYKFCSTYSSGTNTTGWYFSTGGTCEPALSTQAASSIAQTQAVASGTITATNSSNATTRGFKYYQSTDCTGGINDKSENGSYGVGAYNLTINGLTANTDYSYKAFATNGFDTGYGGCVTFKTLPNAPNVTVQAASNNNTGTSITFNGTITTVNGVNATERGFNLYTDNLCTVSTSPPQNPHSHGSFIAEAFSLTNTSAIAKNTTYYYSAYAINTGGTGTSSCQSFTTPIEPTVTVQAASSISSQAATLNGNITITGIGNPADGVIVTERGFRVYTNGTCSGDPFQNPRENNYVGGFSSGAFPLATTGELSAHTDYWYKSYAINSSSAEAGVSTTCQQFTTIDTGITLSVSAASGRTTTGAVLNGTIESITAGDHTHQRGFELYAGSAVCGGTPIEILENGTYGTGAYPLSGGTLLPNGSYSYKAFAVNSTGAKEYSPTCESFYTKAETPSPITDSAQSWVEAGNPVGMTFHANGNADSGSAVNSAGTQYFIQAQEIAGSDPDPQTTCNTTNNWFDVGTWTTRNDLSASTDYRTADKYVCYRIKARNSAGTPEETAYSSTSVVVQAAPAQPTISDTLITYAPTITTSSITWDWNDNVVAPTGYRLYNSATNDQVCADNATSGCTQTQSSPGNNLQPNVSYSVKSQAYRGAITGQPSVVKSAYTAIEPITIITPGAFTTTSLSGSDEGNAISNITAGNSGIQACFYKVVGNILQPPCTEWFQAMGSREKTGLDVNTQYRVEVQSRNGDGRVTTPATLSKYTRANDPITATHSAIATNSITWNWGKNSNPAGTEFYVSDTAGESCNWTADMSECIATGGAKSANTQYTATVKSRNGDGVEEPHVGGAIQASAYTAIQTPTGITSPPALITPNSIVVNAAGTFTNLNSLDSGLCFEVTELDGPSGGGGGTGFTSCTNGTTSTSVTDVGLTHGKRFQYRVRAQNAQAVQTDFTAWSGEFTTTIGGELLFRLPGQNAFNEGNNITGTASHRRAGEAFNVEMYAVDGNYYQDTDEDHLVDVTTTAPSSSITDPTLVNGAITFSVTINSAGTFHLDGLGSAGSSGEFIVDPGTCSAAVSTATANPTSLDVGQSSTLTVTLKDGSGNPLSGHAVSVSTDQGIGDSILVNGLSDASGQVTATVTGVSAHVSTVTVSDITDAVTLSTHPQITFNALAVTNPTGFTATAGNAKVDLAWTNPASFDHINIYRSTTSGVLGAKIGQTTNQTYTDPGLVNGTMYFYTLKAANGAAQESSGTEQLAAMPQSPDSGDHIPPTAPTNLRATELGSTKLTIAWDASTDNVGVTGYQIFNADTQIMVGVTTFLSYNFENLASQTNYRFYVRAYDAAGNFSGYSSVLNLTTLKAASGNGATEAAFLVISNVPDEIATGVAIKGIKISVADEGGKLVTNYTQAVYFSSTDSSANLPFSKKNPYIFTLADAGVHSFSNDQFVFKTAGSQKLTVTDARLSSSKNITVNPGITLSQTASKVRDFFGKPENATRVNTGVVVTSAAVLLAPIIVNSLISAGSILPQLLYWFFQLLQLVGLKRKSKPWGVVFNSQTGQPVPLAVVKIFEKQYNRMLEQAVTDSQGRYGFLAKPGEFYMTVSKTGFTFPPKAKDSSFYEKAYTGGGLKISTDNQAVAFNIPLDPIVGPALSLNIMILMIRINKVLQKVKLPLLLLGLIFAVIMTFAAYNIIYLMSLMFYILIVALEGIRMRKARPYGSVTDTFGHPLDLAIVRIYQKHTNRLIETDVSDSQGRFKFLVNPGVYYITAIKAGYIDYKSHLMYLEKERTMVSSTIKLKKLEIEKE